MLSKKCTLTLAAFGIILLTGCSSMPKAQVDSRIMAWKSESIESLIQFWGLPTNQKQVGNQYFAEWISQRNEPGNTAVSIGTGSRGRNSAIGIGFTLFELGGSEDNCSRLVTYDEAGVIKAIRWQGTGDYCFEVTPDHQKVMANQEPKDSNE